MRIAFITPLLSAMLIAGCMTRRDSRVDNIQPRAASKESFAGTYSNRASYRSKDVLVLQYLDAHLESRRTVPLGATHVVVDFDKHVLRAEVRDSNRVLKTHRLMLGKDYHFEQGCLVFNSRFESESGNDSPTLGFVGTANMRWTMDEQGNLVVVIRTARVGTIAIIPVAVAARGMAIFPRIKTPHPQAGMK